MILKIIKINVIYLKYDKVLTELCLKMYFLNTIKTILENLKIENLHKFMMK